MGTVAPVAQVNAQLFGKMATTFEAIARNPADLKATIAESPSTEQVSTQSLIAQQPLLVDLTTFGQYMTPATQSLKAALPVLNPALEQGTQVLGRTPALNQRLQQTMDALQTLAAGPGHQRGAQRADRHRADAQPDGPVPRPVPDRVQRLELLVDVPRRPRLRGDRVRLRPARAAHPDQPTQPNNVGAQGATAPVNGGCFDSPQGGNEYHARPDLRRGDRQPGQRRLRDRPARLRQAAQRTSTRSTATSSPTRTRRATRARPSHGLRTCPAGETFTRAPTDRAAAPLHPGEPMMRRRRGRKKGMSTFMAGLIAIVAIVVFTYLGFTKFANPFASPYTVHAIFSNANGAEARLAGADRRRQRRQGDERRAGGRVQARRLAAEAGVDQRLAGARPPT